MTMMIRTDEGRREGVSECIMCNNDTYDDIYIMLVLFE